MAEIVTIDSDFLFHLIRIKRADDLLDLIVRFFKHLDMAPQMHPLVYENELQIKSEIILQLFDRKVVEITTEFETIINDVNKRSYYERQVKQIYMDFTGENYPNDDVFNKWTSQKSLGEVHTCVYSAFLNYTCFLSDDNKVSRVLGDIVERRMSRPIKVMNRKDCVEYLKNNKNNEFPRNLLRYITSN